MQFDTHVESEAYRMVGELTAAVPGDLRTILTNILGLKPMSHCNQPARPLKLGPLWWAPGLLAVCCRAYEQPAEKAIPVGACLQLLGVAAGVLDSAQDRENDLMSRHLGLDGNRSSDYKVGAGVSNRREEDLMVALTLNAGVALIGLMWRALLEYGPHFGVESSTVVEIGKLLADLSVRTCYGQHVDLTARSSTQLSTNMPRLAPLTLEDYERLAIDKSGELGGAVCEIAAVLAGAQKHRPQWRKLGTDWMTALQLKDDYADLDEDLASGRLTHSVLYGLEVGDQVQKNRLLSLLAAARGEKSYSPAARSELAVLLESMGASHYTLVRLALLRRQMLTTLASLPLGLEEFELLRGFVLFVAPELDL